MESLIALLREITAPLANIFGQITKSEKYRTDRIINLLEHTQNSVDVTLQQFLKEELYRKVTTELKGVELTQDQLQIIEHAISHSGNRIKWGHIKAARQYLYFEDGKLKVDFHKSDHIFNWIGLIIGILLVSLGMAILFIAYNADLQEKKIQVILTELILFLFPLGFGLFILNGTSPYFAGKKIISELNRKIVV